MSRAQRGPGSGHGGPGGPGFVMPGRKAKDFKGSLRRLMGYLKPFYGTFILVIILAILSCVFNVISPKIMGNITTELSKVMFGGKISLTYILQIILVLVMLYILSSAFTYGQHRLMAGVAQKTVYGLRRDVSEKLSRLPLSYFDGQTHGEILSRVTNDLDNVSNTLQQSITQIITSVATLLGVVIMMLTISPILTLVIVITVPLYMVVTGLVVKKSQKYFRGQQAVLGDLNGHVEEMYTAHKEIKAFGFERKSIEKFREINEKYYHEGWRAQFVSGIIMPMMNLISNIGYVFVCVMGAVLVSGGTVSLGNVQAFMQYCRQFTQPIVQTANIANIIQSTIASAERVFEIIDEREEISDNEHTTVLQKVHGDVSFEHVRFGYQPDKVIIKDLSFKAGSGDTIAIVGPTGAGKTTLVNLLMRFYEIEKGQITVDGNDIKTFSRSALRSLFGMVLQDTWLFNGTIRENIAYGKKNATDEEIVAAARAAHADHFIRTLPDGYDTVLNEEASNISQGQKQLLTIARAVLADPDILILDEATSSVDTRTETLIQSAMNRLMRGRTSFVIAHRLSTIRDASMILVMRDGDVVENGTHEELIAQNGFYAELYNSQFASA